MTHDALQALRTLTPWPPPPQSYGALALEVAEQFGVSPAEQVAARRYLGETFKLSPEAYYEFRLFEPHRFERAHLYVSWDLHERLLQKVYAHVDVSRLADKWQFFRHCGDPAAPVSAWFVGGRLAWRADVLPTGPMFLKPTDLSQGQGHELWRHWDEGELLAHAAEKSREHPCLLQPMLHNHPDNAALSPGLVTARIITCRMPGGAPFLLQAMLRIPQGENVMDHFAGGNLAAPLRDGIIGEGVTVDPRIPPQPLPLRRLAGWEALRHACLAAHQRFPEFPCVGFDAAATPQGPRILEANVYFSANPQLILDEPWGATRYVEIMEAWLFR